MKFLAAGILICACGVMTTVDVPSYFDSSRIVPDVLNYAPNDLLWVKFEDTKRSVQFGEELTPTQVKSAPALAWNSEDSALYTVCMTDPDVPSRANPILREFLHWLVINVPGRNVNKGDVLVPYVGSGPFNGTGFHRYVLLVFKQPTRLPSDTRINRPFFTIQNFANRYDFGLPVAGNMFKAQYDDHVRVIMKQLTTEFLKRLYKWKIRLFQSGHNKY